MLQFLLFFNERFYHTLLQGTQCRLQTPADDPPTELEHLYEKWMSGRDLKTALKKSGVNMFPAEDSHKFVSIQEKVVCFLYSIYHDMGIHYELYESNIIFI